MNGTLFFCSPLLKFPVAISSFFKNRRDSLASADAEGGNVVFPVSMVQFPDHGPQGSLCLCFLPLQFSAVQKKSL
jgi:hypothetical protein